MTITHALPKFFTWAITFVIVTNIGNPSYGIVTSITLAGPNYATNNNQITVFMGDQVTATTGNANGDPVAGITWSETASSSQGGCTVGPQAANADGGTIQLNLPGPGIVTLSATITYGAEPGSNNPIPPPNTINATISIDGPDSFEVNNFDQTQEYPFGGNGNFVVVKFQMMYQGLPRGSMSYVRPWEKISYTIPADTPPENGGNWGGSNLCGPPYPCTPLLSINANGVVSDYKAMAADPTPPADQMLGQTLFAYTQQFGVSYIDFCGNEQIWPVPGTCTVTITRSPTNMNMWRVGITR